jgi:hypothetical protein
MKATNVICGIAFLLCLVAFPVIAYVGGRLCTPLDFPPLFPAEIVPAGVGLLAGIGIMATVIRSLIARQHQAWTLGSLAIIIGAGGAFWVGAPHLPGFLHGLRDRFVSEVGYDRMRTFATELSQGSSLVDPDGILRKPSNREKATPEQQRQWNDLVARYPFVNWVFGYGTVIVREGIVEMTWGSPLTGHWGFRVAPAGRVKNPDEDRCRVLRGSEDIQFVYYFD